MEFIFFLSNVRISHVVHFEESYYHPRWPSWTPKFSHGWLSPAQHLVRPFVLLILRSSCFSSLAQPSFSSLSFSSLGLLITPFDNFWNRWESIPTSLLSSVYSQSSFYAVLLVIFSTHSSTGSMFLLYRRKREGRKEKKEKEGMELAGRAIAHSDSFLVSVTSQTLTHDGHSPTFLPLCLSPSSFLCLWLLWPYPCPCRTILRPAFPCSHHGLAKLEIIFLLFCADKALRF